MYPTNGKPKDQVINHGAISITINREASLAHPLESVEIYWHTDTTTSEDMYFLYRLLKSLQKDIQLGKAVKIIWSYLTEKDELYEMGHDFSRLLDLKFSFLQVERDKLPAASIALS